MLACDVMLLLVGPPAAVHSPHGVFADVYVLRCSVCRTSAELSPALLGFKFDGRAHLTAGVVRSPADPIAEV